MKIAFVIKGDLKNKAGIIADIKQCFSDLIPAFFETEKATHAIEFSRNLVQNKFTHIVAVGGDGTLNEVLNGIMLANENPEVIIAQLPYGTANDFSKTAGFSQNLVGLRHHIFKNRSEKIDIGLAEFSQENGDRAKRYFINIADIGIGGVVVEKVNKSQKYFGADFTFLKAITETLISYKQPRVSLKSDNFNWEGNIITVAAANGKYFGSGLCIAPEAKITDGKLNLTLIGNVSMADYLLNINKVKKGEAIMHPEVCYKEITFIEIEPIEGKCPIDIDGEFVGYAPVSFRVLPGKINFITSF